MALPTHNAEEPKAPLILSKASNLFKLFQNDVGLLACQYSDGIQLRILHSDVNINYGAIYENLTAQELHAHAPELSSIRMLHLIKRKPAEISGLFLFIIILFPKLSPSMMLEQILYVNFIE